jgi:D-arabinose 1-dehydrogenase-like Zn-dependent alcohol dehydrogenase
VRAVVLTAPGPAESLRIETRPALSPGPDDVLVRVRACAVCGRDVLERRGGFPLMQLPTVLGHEFAGEVVSIGERAAQHTELRAGDRVANLHRPSCGACPACLRGDEVLCERAFQSFGHTIDGAYATHVLAPPGALVRVPDSIDFVAASTMMCTAGVALRALRTIANLRAFETILITGASGGVGVMAVQLARAMGARVIAATSSPAKIDALVELGAHEVVLARERFDEAVRAKTESGVDVALELTGAPTFASALRSLRRGGRVVVLGNIEGRKLEINPGSLILHAHQVLGSASCSRRDLLEVFRLLEAGTLRPQIDRVVPLEGVVEAHRTLEARGVIGRIVLSPESS